MGCGKSNPCGGCEDKKPCDCEVKDLGTKCVIYDGEGLEYLNLETNTDTTTVFDFIDDAFVEMKEYVDGQTTGANAVNIGDGEYVYAGKDLLNRLQFKGIVGGDNITVTPTADSIVISSDVDLSGLVKSTDDYIKVTETGGTYSLSFSYNLFSSNDNYIQVYPTPSGVSFGLNVSEIQNLIPDIPDIPDTEIESSTLLVSKVGDTFTIEVPSDGIKRFYVDNQYQGGNSDGSEAKPFTNITQAVNAYIGTGDNINPQFASQNAKIVVRRSGTTYTLPSSLLVNNLWLELEDGVSTRTGISNTEYLIDYTQIPSSYTGRFPITIVGAGRTGSSINVRKPFLSHDGRGIDNNQRILELRGLRLGVNNANMTQPTIKVDSQATSDQIVGVRLFVIDCDIWNNTYQSKLLSFKGLGLGSFNNSEIRFKTSDPETEGDTQTISMEVSGGSVDINNCRLKAYREFVNGAIRVGESTTENRGRIIMKNCIFEGDTPIWFTTEGGSPEDYTVVEISNADYYYDAFGGKLVHTTDSIPSENFLITNSFFKCKLGDADLTKGGTMSVTNYFESVLREDLLRSNTILTTDNSSFKYGTPYLYTVDINDKTTWERRVVV